MNYLPHFYIRNYQIVCSETCVTGVSGAKMIFAFVIACADAAAFMLRFFHNSSWSREESSALVFHGPSREILRK